MKGRENGETRFDDVDDPISKLEKHNFCYFDSKGFKSMPLAIFPDKRKQVLTCKKIVERGNEHKSLIEVWGIAREGDYRIRGNEILISRIEEIKGSNEKEYIGKLVRKEWGTEDEIVFRRYK